jgi:hypothetical protein
MIELTAITLVVRNLLGRGIYQVTDSTDDLFRINLIFGSFLLGFLLSLLLALILEHLVGTLDPGRGLVFTPLHKFVQLLSFFVSGNKLFLPLSLDLNLLEVLLEVIEFVGKAFELALKVAFYFVLGLHLAIVGGDVL